MTFEEIERSLLARLQDKSRDPKPILKRLATLYGRTRHYEKAMDYLWQVMALESNLEEKAARALALGANAEGQEDYETAVQFYRQAFSMEPMHNDTWYFIANSLGFSLNKLGQFSEGEKFCRAAIDINPDRPNGFKNLGVSLEGQYRHAEAARSYVRATKVAPDDTRSLHLLNDLLHRHPSLRLELGDHQDDDLAAFLELFTVTDAPLQRHLLACR